MPPIHTSAAQDPTLQCHCIIINTWSEASRCPFSGALDFNSAQHLSRTSNLPLQILNKEPLAQSETPISLSSFSADSLPAGRRILCGVRDEVRQAIPTAFREPVDWETHNVFVNRVGVVLAFFVLLFILMRLAWKRSNLQRLCDTSEYDEPDSLDDDENLGENYPHIMQWLMTKEIFEPDGLPTETTRN